MEKVGQGGRSPQPTQCRTLESPEHVVHVAGPAGARTARLSHCLGSGDRLSWASTCSTPEVGSACRARWTR